MFRNSGLISRCQSSRTIEKTEELVLRNDRDTKTLSIFLVIGKTPDKIPDSIYDSQ